MNVAVDWLQSLIPEVPPHLQEGSDQETVYFKNTFTGAIAICTIMHNKIIFSSQSASTVASFKEGITRLAIYRRLHLEETSEMPEASVPAFITLLKID